MSNVFNTRLTTVALLALTSVAGTMLTISDVSAQSRSSRGGVKDVTLQDRDGNKRRSFRSNNGIADLSKVGFDNRADFVQINDSKPWRFYTGKNFTGRYTVVKPQSARLLGRFANKVSSFCSVPKCPK